VVELAKAILPVFDNDYPKTDLHKKLADAKSTLFQDRLNKIKG